MRIAVLGSGAMGQLFGAHLVVRGHEVVMIDVSSETCAYINSHGMRIDMGTYEIHADTHAAVAQEVDHEVDLLIVMTKGPHTRDALFSVQHLISKDTIGLSLQNGLDNETPLIDYVGEDHVVIGMTDFPADRHESGTICSEPTGHVVVGEISPGGQERAQKIAHILDAAGLNATYSTDVKIPIWEKVIFNTVYNTVSGATGMKVGGVFGEPEASDLANAVLDESLRVAQEVVDIDETRLRNNIMKAHENHADHKTSMLVDLEAGRPTEIETIGGAVEKTGQRNGTPTPVLSVLCNVIRLRERAAWS